MPTHQKPALVERMLGCTRGVEVAPIQLSGFFADEAEVRAFHAKFASNPDGATPMVSFSACDEYGGVFKLKQATALEVATEWSAPTSIWRIIQSNINDRP